MTIWIDPKTVDIPDDFPSLGLHPLISHTLVRRGIHNLAAVRAFLDPDLYHPAPSSDLPDLQKATERILQAIQKKESICVWGDFDVDGQTATALLVATLQNLKANVTYHIPVRASENHGVNIPVLADFINHGATLVITCDTGSSSRTEVDYARLHGVDVLVTDHHDLPLDVPEAMALVNPKLLPMDHPLATLAGVGVAYKLAEELLRIQPTNTGLLPAELLDLVALGLVADIAQLTGDSRYLVQKGLVQIRQTQRLGLKAILELAELNPANLTEAHIGFVLGPRLNALGRLEDANPAVELLTTQDPVRAQILAAHLESLNTQRQLLARQVYEAAEAQIKADPSLLDQPVLVLDHPAWPGGIIGITASRLVERYNRPVILLASPPGQIIHGSARSCEGINITGAIAAQKELLITFGGHPMAAGLALETENLSAFKRGLRRTVTQMGVGTPAEASIQIDGWMDLSELTLELAQALECLAPYGSGNEKLTLASHNLTLKNSTSIGRNGEHLKLRVEDDRGTTQDVLWWNGAGEDLPDGDFNLAYTLRASDFRGLRQATIEWVAYHPLDAITVKVVDRQRPEVVDYRDIPQPVDLLKQLPTGTLIWAEGVDKKGLIANERSELVRAPALAIWTTPPGLTELNQALVQVQPGKIYIFAITSTANNPEAFLTRLAGLVRFSINQRGGKSTLVGLASAMASREAAVRAGLEWLQASGKITFHAEAGGELNLSASAAEPIEGTYRRWFTILRFIIEETNAYRIFFARADKDGILP